MAFPWLLVRILPPVIRRCRSLRRLRKKKSPIIDQKATNTNWNSLKMMPSFPLEKSTIWPTEVYPLTSKTIDLRPGCRKILASSGLVCSIIYAFIVAEEAVYYKIQQWVGLMLPWSPFCKIKYTPFPPNNWDSRRFCFQHYGWLECIQPVAVVLLVALVTLFCAASSLSLLAQPFR